MNLETGRGSGMELAAKLISIFGVVLATGGTVWSLWDIIVKTDKEIFMELADRFSFGKKMRSAKEQRRHTILGMACIALGALLQIVGWILF